MAMTYEEAELKVAKSIRQLNEDLRALGRLGFTATVRTATVPMVKENGTELVPLESTHVHLTLSKTVRV